MDKQEETTKRCFSQLPDNEFNMMDIIESDKSKITYYWYKDGIDATREIIQNNISNPEIREKMEKKHLVKDVDAKGDAILYPDS